MSKHAELIERLEELAEEAHAYHEGSEFAIKAKADFRGALEALALEIEGLRKDAERYRWLRHGDNDELVLCNGPVAKDYWYLPRNEKLDAAIDAAKGAPNG